ncbi:hypothetical protein CP99DC5_0084 [Chlamydia psittaci 99DC5]|uniref:Uncharacterized protein n=1 Tax=Chlamydia psittaci 99DC5 TaxID=1112251 RepID=A0ABP2X502_CHLPS|nr:hypothetical protein CP99DC5_0084 [Chlamydia psittaci 99DC5]
MILFSNCILAVNGVREGEKNRDPSLIRRWLENRNTCLKKLIC